MQRTILNGLKAEVIRVIRDPWISIERIRGAYYSLSEEDQGRMPYVKRLIALES
jgi:hypothetical protein